MNNIKIIFLGLVALALMGIVIWYASGNRNALNQMASIVDDAGSVGDEIDGIHIGNPDAPVVMVEYSSHFCGHCSVFHQHTLPLIVNAYVKPGKVRMVRVLLSNPSFTEAVLCAQEQGQAVEFDEYLFSNLASIQAFDQLVDIAVDMGMDKEQFRQCFEAEKYQAKIANWMEAASERGVEGTPTFFINEQKLVGNQPYETIRRVIEEELAKTVE